MRGKSWEETAYHSRVVADIEGGHVRYGCDSKEHFQKRLADLDGLFEEIKESGFRPEAGTGKDASNGYVREPTSGFNGHNQVTVCIGRHGDLFLRGGKERLFIAKLLDIQKIPVAVVCRHRQWHAFRQEILAYATLRGGNVYQPLTHPDLRIIPAHHADNRFELMENHLIRKQGTVLDLGANWGYFDHRFEERGFECTAVECNPMAIYFLKKLRRAEHRRFKLVTTSILDLRGELKFEVSLALNIFHHFLKTRVLLDSFLDFLGRLQTDILFFEPPCCGEPIMKGAYINPAPEEFVELVLQHSCLNRSRVIGTVTKRHSLYLLER